VQRLLEQPGDVGGLHHRSFRGDSRDERTDATPGATIYYTTNQTTPTTSSTKYTGPITITGAEYLQAIAAAPGYTTSFVAAGMYSVTGTAVGTPVLSLASGTYTGSQTLSISDATAGSSLYYTTNGSAPTASSTLYSGPITVSSSETVNVIGIKSGYANSALASGDYTINVAAAPSTNAISFTNGFAAKSLTMNGTAALSGTAVQLTNGGSGQAGTAFYPTPVSVASFGTAFDFQLPTSAADGFTFTLQNNSRMNYAMGNNGSGLGYQWITNSVAVAFNLYQSGVANAQSIGVYTGGAVPQGNSVSLVGTPVNLHSGDPFHAVITYTGTTMTVTLTDKVTGATVSETFTVNLASSVGASTAYVGFTGSTGAFTSVQNILDWQFVN
jgi:hypothetical protein